ncbi:PAS domain S-box protein [Spirulina sp. CCNP1310]|uniref:PAS domain S-box protein n=1 Tax=Spirulina sp. CCNP1310 TaxID=3110249 RepID=UPI002B1F6D37|nr:PAS domain S-box protein [Spirulina sp. CCNP1310]MEA5421248.1 PAS domain S-box protein [Spirulina sp. CCNP1310]
MALSVATHATGDILVTDDTPANLRLLTEILVKHGYQVRAARSGQAALAAVQAKQPDLILLDIMMPEMDGFTVCEQLKADPHTRHIPVIFISALDHPADKARAFGVGGIDYIPKPFHREEVLLRVSHHLSLRRAQDALRASETRFRLIFENAGLGIFVAQPDGRILKTNRAFQQFLGYEGSELYQTLCTNCLGAADQSRILQQLAAIGRGEINHYQVEQEYLRADGRQVWGRLILCGAMQDGVVQFVFGMVENIDNQKRAQEALAASEQEMRAIFQAMTDLVVIRDRQGRCLKIAPTQAAAQLSPSELLGKTLQELMPDVAAQLQGAIAHTLDEQKTTKVEYQRHEQQDLVWFDARLSPLSADRVVWVARDVTEDRLIAQKLRHSEQEIRGIFEAMTDLVLVVDAHRQEVQVMPTNYGRLFENSNAVIEATFEQFFPQTHEVNTFWEPIQQVLSNQLTLTFEYRLQLVTGSVWFAANISPLPNDCVIWVARDISARIEAELELQTLAAELEERVIERTAQLRRVNENLRAEISDRIQAEAELGRSEARFRLAVDNIPNMFVIYDRHLRYRFVNHQALKTLGFQRDAMIGHTDRELFPDPITQAYVPLLEKAVAERSIQSGQCTFAVPRQGHLMFMITYVPLLNEEGDIEQILGIALDITEQQRSERVIWQAKEQLQAVLDAVPGFVSWIGRFEEMDSEQSQELYYLGVNHQLASAFDVEPQAFMGQRLGFLNLGSQFEELLQNLFEGPDRMRSQVVDVQIRDQTRHYLVVAQKYQENQAAVSVGIDITARIEAETKLKRAYERSQLLSELTLKVRQSLDLDEILQTVVWEVQQILQTDRVAILQCESEQWGRVIKESVLTGIHPVGLQSATIPCQILAVNPYVAIHDTATPAVGDVQPVLTFGGFPVRSQLLVPIFIQQNLWGSILVQQCHDPHYWQQDEIKLLTALADQLGIAVAQAQLLHHLEERVVERTAELQQEIAERTKAETALRESEAQLHRVIQSNAYGIVVCNHLGRIDFANTAAAELFGRSAQELLDFDLGIPIPSGERVWNREDLAAPTAHGDPTEICLVHPQGRQCIVEMRSVAINWYGKRAYLLSLMDITERKAIEQMKDEFISIASHELRTPLTSIRGSLGLLATGRLGQLSDKGQQMLDIAVNNTDRLTRLLNDILDLERIESGRIKILKRRCDGLELIQQAAQAMVSMAEQNQITLCLECDRQRFATYPLPEGTVAGQPPFSIYVWVDPDQILQTLTNLISNAIKFSERDRSIWLNVTPDEDQVIFSVHDQGRGIPADKCEAIFGRFQQVDASDSREKGGTGLGLSICREIVQRHGGDIWVTSTVGQGSSFYFSIPAQPNGTSEEVLPTILS